MSRQSHRFSLIHQAVVATTVGLVSLAAHGANLSQANIQSAQHEPLSATINVSNIDAKNFSASLANSGIYQQMGLSQDVPIHVHFTPTSDSTGQITLTSAAPINAPFTDVVLALNNNGNQIIEPQTLLMPISKSNIPASLITPVMIAAEHEQDLPVAGAPIDLATGEPLDPIVDDIADQAPYNAQQDPAMPLDNAGGIANHVVDTPDVHAINHDNTQVAQQAGQMGMDNSLAPSQATPTGQIISQESRVLSTMIPEGTNTQLNILTEQVTRRILSDDEALAAENTYDSEEHLQANHNKKTNKKQETKAKPKDGMPTGEAVYVVQSGDNLWTIANKIAKSNNVSVNDVMKQIHKQNPDAFFNNNISQLKTNATLILPSYDVVPSQRAIQEAIAANKQTRSNHDSSTNRNNQTQSTARSQNRQTHHRNKQQNRSPNKPLPKAQMTLVSPSSGGQATGTQARSGKAGVTTNSNNAQLVNTLKTTRNQTASKANHVNSLNQEFSVARQRLQLQNQKLAELEARLKALRDNK